MKAYPNQNNATMSIIAHLLTLLQKPRPLPIRQLIDRYTAILTLQRSSSRPKNAYLSTVRAAGRTLTEWFGPDRDAATLTEPELTRFVHYLREQYSSTTAAVYVWVLRAMFQRGVDYGPLTVNPLRGVSAPVPAASPIVHSVQQVQALMEAAWDHDPFLVPYLALGYFFGLRAAEFQTFEWHQWNTASSSIMIPGSVMGRHMRRIELLNPKQAAWITPFAGKANGLDIRDISRRLKQLLATIADRAGLIAIHLRTLRRTWLIYLHHTGCPGVEDHGLGRLQGVWLCASPLAHWLCPPAGGSSLL